MSQPRLRGEQQPSLLREESQDRGIERDGDPYEPERDPEKRRARRQDDDDQGEQSQERDRRGEPLRRPQIQVVRQLSSLQQETRPGSCPAEDIRLDHRPKRPALQVSDLEIRVQLRRTELPDAASQLRVLDRRERIAVGVELAGTQEECTSDGSATCPERRVLPPRALVNEVMSQVHVLREETGIRRGDVVGTRQAREARIATKRRSNAIDAISVRDTVRIDEQQHVRAAVPRALVARASGPGPLREADDAYAMPLGHRRALVLRSGVDRDDVLATRSRDDRRQDPVQRPRCVVDGNDDVQTRIGIVSSGAALLAHPIRSAARGSPHSISRGWGATVRSGTDARPARVGSVEFRVVWAREAERRGRAVLCHRGSGTGGAHGCL